MDRTGNIFGIWREEQKKMSDLVSGVISLRTFLSKEQGKIGYVEYGKLCEWELPLERKYVIPGYQREINWSPENLQILIDDIISNSKFLGNVLLSTSDQIEYDIIDGRQRLTAIFMILEKINQIKSGGLDFNLCTYDNKTFPYFYKALSTNFNLSEEGESYIKSDTLNQRKTIEKLWGCVCNNLDKYDEQKLEELEEHLLDSRISVLISKVDLSRNESRRVCVDYFIDINNKSVNLDCTDILKAYAFREDFDRASDKWVKIQNSMHNLNIFYPKEAMFYHYFLCVANAKLDYCITGLSEEYKIVKKNAVFKEREYLVGTDIEILLSSMPHFYRDMFDRILEYQKFLHIIKRDKTSPSQEFCDYFKCSNSMSDGELQSGVTAN